MKHILFYICLLFATVIGNLELISDNELEKLIRNEKFVISLFVQPKEKCTTCEDADNVLSSIREDLVDSLNAWVVKSGSSLFISNFTFSDETEYTPKIVYYREGVPMLYDGPLNDEVMLETFIQGQEVAVHELGDDDFEHLTQAATGATTGDWFVMFYRDDCDFCMKFQSRWEFIGSQLKGRINLAKCNVRDKAISTGSRFGVENVPTFLFFRQGRVYHYDIPNLDSKSFKDFALGWYKNVPAKSVPLPKTPFDELIDHIVFILKENPVVLPLCGGVLLCILLFVVYKMWRSKDQEKETKKLKKKRN